MEGFAAVIDPRGKRGVRHSLPTILGLCTAAVLSGCVRLVEIRASPQGSELLDGSTGAALALHTAVTDTAPLSDWDVCLLPSRAHREDKPA